MKAATLAKLEQAARDKACQLFYFDQSGFSASPPVQRGWSPIGEPHRVFPQPHCRRSVLGALDFGANLLTHHASKTTIKRPDVVQFLDQIARESTPGLTTVVVLDNASIHHNIDQETIDQWFLEHRMVLFYLPPYSPELNRIETLWKHAKYHWRRFVTWTKETIDAEIENLLGGYGVPSLKFVSHEHLMTIIRLRIAIAHSMPSVGRTAATAVLFNWRRLAQFNRSGAQRRSGNVLAVIVALALMNRPATGPCSGTRADNASL